MYFHIHIASADPRVPKRPCCCLLGMVAPTVLRRVHLYTVSLLLMATDASSCASPQPPALAHSFRAQRPLCCQFPPVSSHGFSSNIQHRACPTVIELVQNIQTRQVLCVSCTKVGASLYNSRQLRLPLLPHGYIYARCVPQEI
jgi:hypothetical protein